MKRSYRLFALAMVMVLAAVALSGCGKKNSLVGQWAIESDSYGEIE